MRPLRLSGLLVHVMLFGCGSDTMDRSREVVDRSVDRSREVVDRSVDRSREVVDHSREVVGDKLEVVDDKLEVARDRLADAGAELGRTGREGLRQANEGLDRWLEQSREELGSDYQPIPGAAEAIHCETDTRCTIDAKFIDELGRNPRVLAGEAVALPAQGKADKGLGLSSVRAGSIPAQLGLRDGDVLISLNGTNFVSLEAPRALADALSNTNEAKLVFERAGQQRTLTVTRSVAK